jgi:hypothetical protein
MSAKKVEAAKKPSGEGGKGKEGGKSKDGPKEAPKKGKVSSCLFWRVLNCHVAVRRKRPGSPPRRQSPP